MRPATENHRFDDIVYSVQMVLQQSHLCYPILRIYIMKAKGGIGHEENEALPDRSRMALHHT
jgi:hypothetical protein